MSAREPSSQPEDAIPAEADRSSSARERALALDLPQPFLLPNSLIQPDPSFDIPPEPAFAISTSLLRTQIFRRLGHILPFISIHVCTLADQPRLPSRWSLVSNVPAGLSTVMIVWKFRHGTSILFESSLCWTRGTWHLTSLPRGHARSALQELSIRKLIAACGGTRNPRSRDLGTRFQVPRRLREAIVFPLPRLDLERSVTSPVDGFQKLLFRTGDGLAVETVLIPLHKPAR